MSGGFDPASLCQSWPMPARPRPIVVIGAGGIARDAHLPAYRQAGFAVGGIFDVDKARAVHHEVFAAAAPFLPLICLAIVISVAATHWPLRVAYALSRGALDAVSLRVRAGERIAVPLRAGLFMIRRAEISHDGFACLWTDLHPTGYTGFMLCGPRKAPGRLWSQINLDDRWQFVSED